MFKKMLFVLQGPLAEASALENRLRRVLVWGAFLLGLLRVCIQSNWKRGREEGLDDMVYFVANVDIFVPCFSYTYVQYSRQI